MAMGVIVGRQEPICWELPSSPFMRNAYLLSLRRLKAGPWDYVFGPQEVTRLIRKIRKTHPEERICLNERESSILEAALDLVTQDVDTPETAWITPTPKEARYLYDEMFNMPTELGNVSWRYDLILKARERARDKE